MDDTVIKEEVIEEEIERKPENLLEKKIKTEHIDLFETNEPDDELFEAVKLKKVSITGTTKKDRTLRRADCEIGLLLKQKIRNQPIDFFGNNNSDQFLENIELNKGECAFEIEKEMIEADIEEDVIEDEFSLTLKNGEFVEVKQEEIEQKPEYLLEKKVKTEPIDLLETNEPDEFFDVFELEAEGGYSKIETVSTEVNKLKCEICQKTMPRSLLKLIKSEEQKKTVLAEMFKIGRSLETKIFYVRFSHIQTIIDENDEKLKSPSTRYEQLLRTFISKHKKLTKQRKDSKMIEADIEEGVFENEFNFMFKNDEFVEVKQEEIKQKPEHLLEKEIKAETDDDCFETNDPNDEFSDDTKPEPKESDSKIEKVSKYVTNLECGVCQKMIPINLVMMTERKRFSDGVQLTSCQDSHIIKPQNDIYEISSNRIRIVLMIGCILRGTHRKQSPI